MAYSDSGCSTNVSPRSSTERRRSSSPGLEKRLEQDDVIQGRILWLPPRKDLPERAVRRAHGKGAVEEGIYNHPVVVISRPAEEADVVHFHLITSFQGKKLHEIYSKANEFHASRRSWYLPVYPSPDHPDAISKKARKKFPTLQLRGNAVLRWDSYVNIRHVYKTDWRYLRPYTNPDIPGDSAYHFERDSMIRMLSKGRLLTNYEVGRQQNMWTSPCVPAPNVQPRTSDDSIRSALSHSAEDRTENSAPSSGRSTPEQQDFLESTEDTESSIKPQPRKPPDDQSESRKFGVLYSLFEYLVWWPRFLLRRLIRAHGFGMS